MLAAMLLLAACDDPADAGVDAGPDAASADASAPDATPGNVRLAADRTSVDLGVVHVGETGLVQRVTVTSTGTGAAVGLAVQVVGAAADEIAIDAPGTSCQGATLPPGASCDVSLRFAPLRDASASAILRITASGTSLDVPLTGEGVVSCDLSISPTPFTFGDVPTGSTSAPRTFTVINPCRIGVSGTLAVSLTISLGSFATQFVLGTDTCTGTTLAARASCTVDVAFAAADVGPRTGTLQVVASPGGTVSAALAGNGI